MKYNAFAFVLLSITLFCSVDKTKAQTVIPGGIEFRTTDEKKQSEHNNRIALRSLSDICLYPSHDPKDSLCIPEYSTGCSDGDGFTDFALAEIENYDSDCEDLNGTGWSQYFNLGPALLLPGVTYDVIMSSGYGDQYVSIWIDFNNDELLTEDEKILSDFNLNSSGTLYTAQITLPMNAAGGQHIMRARTNWAGSCNDPCENYTYGEAEDYYVLVSSAAFGSLEGSVTELSNGEPVSGAQISLSGIYTYSDTTDSSGYFHIENILEGSYNVTCFKTGYNIQTSSIPIIEDSLSVLDFVLTHPEISVIPESVDIILSPNATGEKELIVGNTGNGPLHWAASLQILSNASDDFMDLQFQHPVEVGGGEAGIETDGEFFYTTKWNGDEIFKYAIDGNYVGVFTIEWVSALRDLAFDGTYFYGGTGLTTIYEMDFVNEVLISSFTTPENCRAIAYDDNGDFFYGNNWSSPVTLFDKTGANLGTFNVGPEGGEYYGFAYDGVTFGGPFLWGYAQVGDSKNTIIQMQLPSGTETGFTLDVATKLSGTLYNFAGGLFTHPNIVLGKWTLGGLVQNQWFWGLELTDAQTWIGVNPASGILDPTEADTLTVHFDASEMTPGIYEAQILITSEPEVGSPVIAVTMTVTDETLEPPVNLSYSVACDSAELCWEIANPSVVDSFFVSVDEALVSTTDLCCFVKGPGSHNCYVIAWYSGSPSAPSETLLFDIPVPENSEPLDFTIDDIMGNVVVSSWQIPAGCAIWDGFNLYRDGVKMNTGIINGLTYSDTVEFGGSYQYYVTAQYYFGESEPSNIDTVVIPLVQESEDGQIQIFPNPASRKLYIQSKRKINFISIRTVTGKMVFEEVVTSNNSAIDISHFEPGIYFLKAEFQNNQLLRKVVIR